eukprot:TRINITY_DN3501_c0_g1_i1.p1 TRINITY_DN3501_c0_g1~~TRINITY_DN3501_c0_g1_i1.p1  ORF type:complete len:1764 (-),score=536.09 TRINITY_DN3501_c0_g1_i1:278-5569(-)
MPPRRGASAHAVDARAPVPLAAPPLAPWIGGTIKIEDDSGIPANPVRRSAKKTSQGAAQVAPLEELHPDAGSSRGRAKGKAKAQTKVAESPMQLAPDTPLDNEEEEAVYEYSPPVTRSKARNRGQAEFPDTPIPRSLDTQATPSTPAPDRALGIRTPTPATPKVAAGRVPETPRPNKAMGIRTPVPKGWTIPATPKFVGAAGAKKSRAGRLAQEEQPLLVPASPAAAASPSSREVAAQAAAYGLYVTGKVAKKEEYLHFDAWKAAELLEGDEAPAPAKAAPPTRTTEKRGKEAAAKKAKAPAEPKARAPARNTGNQQAPMTPRTPGLENSMKCKRGQPATPPPAKLDSVAAKRQKRAPLGGEQLPPPSLQQPAAADTPRDVGRRSSRLQERQCKTEVKEEAPGGGHAAKQEEVKEEVKKEFEEKAMIKAPGKAELLAEEKPEGKLRGKKAELQTALKMKQKSEVKAAKAKVDDDFLASDEEEESSEEMLTPAVEPLRRKRPSAPKVPKWMEALDDLGTSSSSVAPRKASRKSKGQEERGLEGDGHGGGAMEVEIPSTSTGSLREGSRVRIEGIKSMPLFNGCTGVCEARDVQQGRWFVKLDNTPEEAPSDLVTLKPENLRLLDTQEDLAAAAAAAKSQPTAGSEIPKPLKRPEADQESKPQQATGSSFGPQDSAASDAPAQEDAGIGVGGSPPPAATPEAIGAEEGSAVIDNSQSRAEAPAEEDDNATPPASPFSDFEDQEDGPSERRRDVAASASARAAEQAEAAAALAEASLEERVAAEAKRAVLDKAKQALASAADAGGMTDEAWVAAETIVGNLFEELEDLESSVNVLGKTAVQVAEKRRPSPPRPTVLPDEREAPETSDAADQQAGEKAVASSRQDVAETADPPKSQQPPEPAPETPEKARPAVVQEADSDEEEEDAPAPQTHQSDASEARPANAGPRAPTPPRRRKRLPPASVATVTHSASAAEAAASGSVPEAKRPKQEAARDATGRTEVPAEEAAGDADAPAEKEASSLAADQRPSAEAAKPEDDTSKDMESKTPPPSQEPEAEKASGKTAPPEGGSETERKEAGEMVVSQQEAFQATPPLHLEEQPDAATVEAKAADKPDGEGMSGPRVTTTDIPKNDKEGLGPLDKAEKAAKAPLPERVLLCGDLQGRFDLLHKVLLQLKEKNQAVDFVLAMGRTLTKYKTKAVCNYIGRSAKLVLPVPLYFIEEDEDYFITASENKGVGGQPIKLQKAGPIEFLGSRGVREIQGLRIAFLSGKYDEEAYASAFGAGVFHSSTPTNYTCRVVEEIKSEASKMPVRDGRHVDLLLTSEWPDLFWSTAQKQEAPTPVPEEHQSPAVRQLFFDLKPRYHACASAGMYRYRKAAQGPHDFIATSIALARAEEVQDDELPEEETKWFHVLNLNASKRGADGDKAKKKPNTVFRDSMTAASLQAVPLKPEQPFGFSNTVMKAKVKSAPSEQHSVHQAQPQAQPPSTDRPASDSKVEDGDDDPLGIFGSATGATIAAAASRDVKRPPEADDLLQHTGMTYSSQAAPRPEGHGQNAGSSMQAAASSWQSLPLPPPPPPPPPPHLLPLPPPRPGLEPAVRSMPKTLPTRIRALDPKKRPEDPSKIWRELQKQPEREAAGGRQGVREEASAVMRVPPPPPSPLQQPAAAGAAEPAAADPESSMPSIPPWRRKSVSSETLPPPPATDAASMPPQAAKELSAAASHHSRPPEEEAPLPTTATKVLCYRESVNRSFSYDPDTEEGEWLSPMDKGEL